MTTPTDLARFNHGVLPARHDYHQHPTSFAGPDTCFKCVWPVVRQNCEHCRMVARVRRRRAGKAAA